MSRSRLSLFTIVVATLLSLSFLLLDGTKEQFTQDFDASISRQSSKDENTHESPQEARKAVGEAETSEAGKPTPTDASKPTSTDERPTVGLEGRIVDADGAPVPFAKVVAFTKNTPVGETSSEAGIQTDEKGRFVVEDLIAQTDYTLRVVKTPFEDGWFEKSTEKGSTDIGDLVLRDGSAIKGVVVDPAGVPVKGARVAALILEMQEPDYTGFLRLFGGGPSAFTDETGSFAIEGVTPGRIRLRATHAYFSAAECDPIIIGRESSTTGVRMQLSEGRPLRGQLVDDRGVAIGGAVVKLLPLGAIMDIPSVLSDTNGSFNFPSVARDRFAFIISKDGFPEKRYYLGETSQEVIIEIPRPSQLHGVVQGVQHSNEGLRVVATRSGEVDRQAACQWVTSEGHHEFELTNLPAGKWVLSIEADGCVTRQMDIHAQPGDSAFFKVSLDPAQFLEGHLVDSQTRTPVAGATILARSIAQPEIEERATSDPNGLFRVDHLVAGSYTLRIVHGSYAEQSCGPFIAPSSQRYEITLDEGGSIEGIVTNETGDAADRVFIVARGPLPQTRMWRARADLHGAYRIDHLASGNYHVRALTTTEASWDIIEADERDLFGGDGTGVSVRVDGQSISRCDLAAQSLAVLSGRISCNGHPVGTKVELSRVGAEFSMAAASTDDRGHFQFEPVIPGDYVLSVTANRSKRNVNLSVGQNLKTLELPDTSVRGRVLSEDGKPLDGVLALLRTDSAGETSRRTARTNQLGEFEIAYMEEGSHKLELKSEEHVPWKVTLDQGEGDHNDLGDVRLDEGASIDLTISHPSGGRPEFGFLRFEKNGETVRQNFFQNGKTRVNGLASGRYVVRVLDKGFDTTVEIDVPEEGVIEKEVIVEKKVTGG